MCRFTWIFGKTPEMTLDIYYPQRTEVEMKIYLSQIIRKDLSTTALSIAIAYSVFDPNSMMFVQFVVDDPEYLSICYNVT